jgi:hypothetical protein
MVARVVRRALRGRDGPAAAAAGPPTSGRVEDSRDLVLERQPLFLERLDRCVIRRFDIRLHPMNGPVDLVIFVGEAREVGVGNLQPMDRVGFVGKFVMKFMGDVAHSALRSFNVVTVG